MGGRGSKSASSSLSQISEERIAELADDWSGTGFRSYRRVTKGLTEYANGLPIGEETIKQAREFDAWVDSGSYGERIYRGIVLPDSNLVDWEVGATIDQQGTSSWSKKVEIAEKFSGYSDYNRVVLSMNGTKRGRDIEQYSFMPHEAEVTVSSKSSQVIRKIERKNGIMYVEVEEV